MKSSKRITALFAAVLMVITMFTGTITAFATDEFNENAEDIVLSMETFGAYPTFKSGGHDVNKILIVSSQMASSGTSFSGAKAEYLVAITVASQYDKNGNKGKLDTKDSYAYDAYHSGGAKITCSGTNRYKSVTSTHSAKYKGYAETASNLTKTV